ncbi:RING-box protein 2, partial [Eschrichtius robustus]|nr:RING-box protein 2 [Eschrichtius robustus]
MPFTFGRDEANEYINKTTSESDACLRCQAENKQEDCVVVWGECNHSFHNCCMSLWVKQNNRCPLCQQDWVVQRIGK